MDIGVAYYPEHWPRSRWAEDFALMRAAGLSRVRLAEFAWCRLEPREGVFDFAWLDEAVELAHAAGLRSLLCTPTQAPPPWLSMNYPETRPCDRQGTPFAQGSRRHVDAASPAYRYFSVRIATEMARRYGDDARVWGWQLDNEIGAHTHFVSGSPQAQARFRDWLRRRYGTVEALNEAWGLIFWSGEVREWSEVELRENAPTGLNPAFFHDVRRFGQELWVDFLLEQYRAMKPLVGAQPIMHNIAWYGEQIDLWRLGEVMDINGIDMYQTRPELLSAVDDLYRATAGGKPWAVLEMGCDTGRWQEPGAEGPHTGRLCATLVKHALAGACLASMFRFQPSPSGSEQPTDRSDGGLRDAFGRPTAVVDECRQARTVIDALTEHLASPLPPSRVAIVWDTDDLLWSECGIVAGRKRTLFNDYPREIQELHHQLCRLGIRPTYTRFGADWSGYGLVIVWDHFLADPVQAAHLRAYVAGGGAVLANHVLGFNTRAGRRTACPLPLELIDVFGCTVRRQFLRAADGPVIDWQGHRFATDQRSSTLSAEGGTVLAEWQGIDAEHRAALVANRHGSGRTLYVGGLLDRAGWQVFLPLALDELGIAHGCPIQTQEHLEILPDRDAWLLTNTERQPLTVIVDGRFRDLIGGGTVEDRVELPGHGVALLRELHPLPSNSSQRA